LPHRDEPRSAAGRSSGLECNKIRALWIRQSVTILQSFWRAIVSLVVTIIIFINFHHAAPASPPPLLLPPLLLSAHLSF
jgi:hypothetical protein